MAESIIEKRISGVPSRTQRSFLKRSLELRRVLILRRRRAAIIGEPSSAKRTSISYSSSIRCQPLVIPSICFQTCPTSGNPFAWATRTIRSPSVRSNPKRRSESWRDETAQTVQDAEGPRSSWWLSVEADCPGISAAFVLQRRRDPVHRLPFSVSAGSRSTSPSDANLFNISAVCLGDLASQVRKPPRPADPSRNPLGSAHRCHGLCGYPGDLRRGEFAPHEKALREH